MKTSSEGFQQCTNAQVTVDGKNQMIAATVVGRGATDKGQLLPMVDAAAATGGRMPAEVLADTVTATKRISPRWRHGESEAMWRWAGKAGSTPPTTATGGLPRTGWGNTWRCRKGRAAYAERKWLSEAPKGWIEEVLGFRRFHERGQKKVQGEWSRVCPALNIPRMSGLAMDWRASPGSRKAPL